MRAVSVRAAGWAAVTTPSAVGSLAIAVPPVVAAAKGVATGAGGRLTFSTPGAARSLALVVGSVVGAAQSHQVVDVGGPAVLPLPYMVDLAAVHRRSAGHAAPIPHR